MKQKMSKSTNGGDIREFQFLEHPQWCVANSGAKKKFHLLMASTRATCDLIACREKAIFGHVDSQGIKHEGLLDALASASSGDQKSIAEELRSMEEELCRLDLFMDASQMDFLFPEGKVMRTQPGEKDSLLLGYFQNAKIESKKIDDMIFKFTSAMFEIAEMRSNVIGFDEGMPYNLFEERQICDKEEVESSEMFLEPQESQSELEMACVLPAIQQDMDDKGSRIDSREDESSVLTEEEKEEEEMNCNFLASFDAAEPRKATHAELQQDFLFGKMDQFLVESEVCIAKRADKSWPDTQIFLSQSPMKNLLILEEQLHHVVQEAHALFKLDTSPFHIPQNLSSQMEVGTKSSHADIFCLVGRNDEIIQDCREIAWPLDNPD